VSWTNYRVAPGGDRQDFYPPVVNPYDPNHLLMTGHHMSLIVQSMDGGRSWSAVSMADGMKHGDGTALIFFIDTGRADTTTDTWIWTAEGGGGKIGTWRTSDRGRTWTQVDSNEHPHGQMQIYQPDTRGVVWARMSTPPEMAIGPAQTATVFDGTNFIVLTANWRGGLWRFVE